MCIATFDETVANVTTYQWRVNGSASFRNGVSFSDDNSTLTVTNVSVSDEGAYTCIATLDIAGLEILTNTTANATYDVLTPGKLYNYYYILSLHTKICLYSLGTNNYVYAQSVSVQIADE